jgi:hypothetical protein
VIYIVWHGTRILSEQGRQLGPRLLGGFKDHLSQPFSAFGVETIMFSFATIILSAGFGMAIVILFGERGYAVDLRSRRGRRAEVVGGRRDFDPVR